MNIFEKLRVDKKYNDNEMEKSWTVADLVRTFDKEVPKFRIDRNKINRIENGSQPPDADILIAYSKVFNVSTDYLLNLTNIPFKNEDIIKLDELGLSSDAIKTLKLFESYADENANDLLNVLNFLLSDIDNLYSLLIAINLYLNNDNLAPVHYNKTLNRWAINSKPSGDIFENGKHFLTLCRECNEDDTSLYVLKLDNKTIESIAIANIQKELDALKIKYKERIDANETT